MKPVSGTHTLNADGTWSFVPVYSELSYESIPETILAHLQECAELEVDYRSVERMEAWLNEEVDAEET